MIAADVLAKSGEAAKSGPIGLAVILILCIACYFLFKSMSKHLRTVREDAANKSGRPTTPPTSAPPASDAGAEPVRREGDQPPAGPSAAPPPVSE